MKIRSITGILLVVLLVAGLFTGCTPAPVAEPAAEAATAADSSTAAPVATAQTQQQCRWNSPGFSRCRIPLVKPLR